MNLFSDYTDFFERKLVEHDRNQHEGIGYWRDKLFSYLIMILAPVSIVAYVPSVYMSILANIYVLAIFDTFAIVSLFIIVFSNKISVKSKKILFLSLFYVLAVILMMYLGPNGPGYVYLLALSVLILLLYNSKAGYASIVINFFLSFIPVAAMEIGTYDTTIFDEFALGAIAAFSMNLLMLNVVTVVGVAIIIEGMQKSFLQENTLRKQLKSESIKLNEAKIKAEQSDKLKSAFLANMSHEIRTPMNSIVGFTSLLQTELKPSEMQEYIEIITKNSKYLLALINDIIDLSKIESGILTVNNEKIDLEDFFASLIRNHQLLNHNEIELYAVYEIPEHKRFLQTDASKLNQILSNFISNAYKYTKKGYIEIGAKMSTEENYIFYVKDTGIGINEEIKNKIFDRFYQFNEQYDGAGLGLAISKSLADLICAKINFTSIERMGSTFELELSPQNNNNDTEHIMLEKNIDIPLKSGKILVAEDQEDNYLLIQSVLTKFGYDHERAVNGVEALEKAKQTNYGLILMDIKMPLLNGEDAARMIKRFDPDLKIIAVTAYAMDSDKEHLLNVGFDDYISKPIEINELRKKISVLIR